MDDLTPVTRQEQYYDAILGGDGELPDPVTREEKYLYEIAANGGGGGGGGEGTRNYNQLLNKPKINGVTLSGDLSSQDLHIEQYDDTVLSERVSAVEEGKVDKVAGKGLSTEDFTTEEKEKLASLVPGGGGDAVLTASLTASKTVGGITSGKQYQANTPLETLFRDMLNPVEAPSFTAPSATLSAAGSMLVEEGTTAEKTLTVNFNRGKIEPAYGTSGYRSGPATGYSLNGGIQQSGNTFNVTVGEGNKVFTVEVNYAAGEQPKNSAGENYGEPLAEGSVNTNTLTFEIVAALWSNASNIETVAKEQLISKSVKQKQFNFPAQTTANPEVFDVPASWTVTAVELLNTLNNQWVDCSSEFSVTAETHGTVEYKRYRYNGGDATGARSIRVKWS